MKAARVSESIRRNSKSEDAEVYTHAETLIAPALGNTILYSCFSVRRESERITIDKEELSFSAAQGNFLQPS